MQYPFLTVNVRFHLRVVSSSDLGTPVFGVSTRARITSHKKDLSKISSRLLCFIRHRFYALFGEKFLDRLQLLQFF